MRASLTPPRSMMNHSGKDIRHFENLDALRSLAFLSVFLWHVYGYLDYTPSSDFEKMIIDRLILKGYLGVNFFFVLSGFLITYLLIREKENSGKIGILSFYRRRILRIWPLYFLIIMVGFFIYPWIIGKANFGAVKDHITYYLFFLSNFDRISTGFVGIGNDNLGVLWSIAVEEQFYLIWPLLLAWIPTRYYKGLFLIIVALAVLFRVGATDSYSLLYFHTFSVMSDLALGGLLAHQCYFSPAFTGAIRSLPQWIVIAVYALFIALLFLLKEIFSVSSLIIWERIILALFFMFILVEQSFCNHSFIKVGRYKILTWLGTISYGLYCMNLLSISLIQKINAFFQISNLKPALFYTEMTACLALSIAASWLSFRYFESRFLVLKRKYSPEITA